MLQKSLAIQSTETILLWKRSKKIVFLQSNQLKWRKIKSVSILHPKKLLNFSNHNKKFFKLSQMISKLPTQKFLNKLMKIQNLQKILQILIHVLFKISNFNLQQLLIQKIGSQFKEILFLLNTDKKVIILMFIQNLLIKMIMLNLDLKFPIILIITLLISFLEFVQKKIKTQISGKLQETK